MGSVRRQILFSGRVQGVCFRATTREVADRFAVAGFVRNLADGRVELVAEGEPSELDRFVETVQEAMSGFIRNAEISESEPRDEFNGFAVRY